MKHMDNNYLEFIQRFLGNAPEMVPEPTDINPAYREEPDVRVVIFDIYGTLIISASGDIEESEISVRNLEQSLDTAGIRILPPAGEKQRVLIQMLQSFKSEIVKVHESEKSSDKPYPEVDILAIWESILIKQRELKNLEICDGLCIKCFTFVFEILSNNIYPMPGMKEVINNLIQSKYPIGIISNAQFYTPVIVNYFLNGKITDDETVEPFDPEITVFSYQHKRAKPDPHLFHLITESCREKYDASPDQIIFVGNDMFRDVYPAKRAGFKTVLFAGDDRSLRLREENAEISHIEPDHIITDLRQLLKIIV